MTITLRKYQREALDALYSHWSVGGGNGLVVLPTGAGKSLVLAKLVEELVTQYPKIRICCVTHVKELILQNYQELIRLWPGAPAGIYSAGVGRRDTHSKILFCGIQSIWNKTALIGSFDLIIVDEVHLIPRDSSTTYAKFIAAMRDTNPEMRIVGLTATPYRMTTGRLDAGEGALFDRIIYEANVIDLINDGYLSKLISKATASSIDLTGIGSVRGDFIQSELEAASMADGLVQEAVSEIIEYGKDRRAWLAFCTGVKHAMAVRDEIRRRGITCETVDGSMDKGSRDGVIRRFKNGEIRCLTSVNVLSIGFNAPQVDLIALMRATRSTGLYIQQVGRGFRLAHGKKDCLVLDFAKVIRMHGPVDAVSILPSTGGKGGKVDPDEVRAKECPGCQELVALNTRTCKNCGHEWPHEEKPKHEGKAEGEVGILSTEKVPPTMLPVVDWHFYRHQKLGSPDSMRVDYMAGIGSYREWIAFEHTGYARQKACQFWTAHGGATPFPKSTDEALVRSPLELTMPATISVKPRPGTKYIDIIGRSFPVKEAAE